MIRSLLIITFLIIVSCNHKQSEFDNFEISKIDYNLNKLQRIFVVVPSEKVNDTLFISRVICALKNSYPIEKKTNISFFSNKKYADYKGELFMDGEHLLQSTEYENWSNAYLGEYEFETNEYNTFPDLSLRSKQREYKLRMCY